jgi:hypothetical protein
VGQAPSGVNIEKEIVMKKAFLFVGLLCAVMLISSPLPSITSAAEGAKKQRAEFRFTQPVNLMGVTLKGKYLFVHDDAAMARGDACTFVYKGEADVRDNLVISFHCSPKERGKVGHFTVRTRQTPSGLEELTEFQFAGSTESHLVPLPVN